MPTPPRRAPEAPRPALTLGTVLENHQFLRKHQVELLAHSLWRDLQSRRKLLSAGLAVRFKEKEKAIIVHESLKQVFACF